MQAAPFHLTLIYPASCKYIINNNKRTRIKKTLGRAKKVIIIADGCCRVAIGFLEWESFVNLEAVTIMDLTDILYSYINI